ncbi:MAG: ATP-grasp fold amidoligase family protein [Pseudomonadota bacterium]
MRKKLRYRLRSVVRPREIAAKWQRDCEHLPLVDAHWPVYRALHNYCDRALCYYPDLVTCPDFGSKIQWLKLFDQNPLLVTCADKIKSRDFVAERIGRGYAPTLYATADRFEDIDLASLPNTFVAKANHDCGSSEIVNDKHTFDSLSVGRRLNAATRRVYGADTGEWHYQHIKPKVLVEERLVTKSGGTPPDYKFHCVDGIIRFISITIDRDTNTKKFLVDGEGNKLQVVLNTNHPLTQEFELSDCFQETCRLVTRVAQGFKYVRVDTYILEDRIVFGELTFFPRSGAYRGEGQRALSRFLDFDRSTFAPPFAGRSAAAHDVAVNTATTDGPQQSCNSRGWDRSPDLDDRLNGAGP